MAEEQWKKEAAAFFETRSNCIEKDISWEHLSYVSGKDPRLWTPEMYADAIGSIKEQLNLDSSASSLLEVGCAAGFMAKGLSGVCKSYTGVDVAPGALKVAAKLNLANATFKLSDGNSLAFENNTFDSAVCYDVFINLPDFESSKKIISEMLRVVKPGGKIMIGSVPDKAFESKVPEAARSISEKLEKEFGPLKNPEAQEGFLSKMKKWYIKNILKIEPRIICYYFSKNDFEEFGKENGWKTEILDIHKLNPYYGLRFNVVYTKNPQ